MTIMDAQISKLRVVRPTSYLDAISNMYIKGLGFELLSKFDGVFASGRILGHKSLPYNFEFTSYKGYEFDPAPSKDHLLVFYIRDTETWNSYISQMTDAGFKPVSAFNDYWDRTGQTFEDLDGYRVVIEIDKQNNKLADA